MPNQMSWSDSGQTQPAPNTPKGYAFFAAIFNYIFGKHNTLDTTVSAATSAATPSAIAARDAKGGANFGANVSTTNAALSAAAPDAVTYGLYGRSFVGGTMAERWQTQGGGADIRTTDALGNGFYAGTLTVPTGFIGPLTGNVTGSVSGTAAGLAAPVSFAAAIADYKLVPSVSAGQVTVSAGGQYGDSLGNAVGPLSAQPATLPTQPTGTNIQYCAVSLAPATGAPVVTPGVVGASPAKPAYPVGNAYVGMVTWRGATTLPSGVVAAGDIAPALIGGGGGGSSGGGGATDATVRAATLWLDGANAALPNAVDSTSGTGNGFMHPKYVKNAATDASLYDTFSTSTTGNIVGALASGTAASGLRLVVNSGNPPIVVALPGVTREIVATTDVQGSAPTPGTAGLYQVLADLTGTGPLFVPTLIAAGASFGSNKTVVAQLCWTGTAWDFTTVYYPQFPLINSSQVKLVTIPAQTYAGGSLVGNSGAAFQVMPNATPVQVNLPRAGMRAVITLAVGVQMAATAVSGAVGLQVSLVPASSFALSGLSAQENLVGAASTFYKYVVRYEAIIPQAGPLTVEAIYLNTGAFNCTSQTATLWGEFSG